MHIKLLVVVLLSFTVIACHRAGSESESHEHHEDSKSQYTAYSENFELFAEADAFVVGETANVLSHFSTLPDFKAVEKAKITLILAVNGKETRQTLAEPTRKGIYSFDIQPATAGAGNLTYEITNEKGSFVVIVPKINVFANHKSVHEASEKAVVSKTNTTVFTKEQSWKIDFATAYPTLEPFGEVIKTTALVQSAPGSEQMVTAKTNGVVVITSANLLEGKDVVAGQTLFSISGENFSDNNISVKYAEAKSNFEKDSADYERAKSLAADKIVSAKDLVAAKNRYENAKAVYESLNRNFNASGQTIKSPMSGFVKQLLVKNGTYVEAGQPVMTVSQNKTLVLTADLPQKYASVLANISSANIRNTVDKQSYTFEQLNAKVLSYGKAANSDNFLIPVNIQIDNRGNFMAGSFVEVYLKTLTNKQALIVPNGALLEEQGVFFVWVQITPELFEKREVVAGKTDGISTEILQGITSSERIVTRGAMIIKLAQATGTLDAHSGHVH
jgi:RND family efflux transporter MFP subunit